MRRSISTTTLSKVAPRIAVKASARRSVPGIVHDASDSGQTLFVEPFEVVELSNRQSEATSAEREEVERILRELSAAVGEAATLLTAAVEVTGQIDLTVALGTLSRGQWWQLALGDDADAQAQEALHGQFELQKKALDRRFEDKVEKVRRGHALPPGVMEVVKVFLPGKRKPHRDRSRNRPR